MPISQTQLSTVLSNICEAINWDYGEIWLLNENSILLELSPIWSIHPLHNQKRINELEQFRLCSEQFVLALNEGMPGRVWLSRQPEWIADVSGQSENYFLRNQIAKAFGIKGGLGVPIIARQQVLGVLAFFTSQTYTKDQQIISSVTTAAAKLGGGNVIQYSA